MFCKEQVAQLRAIEPQIEKEGAQLVVVGNGSAEQATWFREDTGFDGELYTDPSLETYKLLGMRSGVATTLGPAVMMRGLRTMRAGFRQTTTMGHAFQQGGVLIVMPDGSIPYRYISGSAGDHPDPRDILSALRAATIN
ncbi:MAG: peroxiredoxin-like family protein [Dehalococcoidia bacterium]